MRFKEFKELKRKHYHLISLSTVLKNVEKAIIDRIVEDEKTYTTDVLPTTKPLKAIRVSVLYQGTKETKWIDCTYNTNILLSFPTQVHGYFSHKGDKINIKRVLKWKYR